MQSHHINRQSLRQRKLKSKYTNNNENIHQTHHKQHLLDSQSRANDDFSTFSFRPFDSDEQPPTQLWTSSRDQSVTIPSVDVEVIIPDTDDTFWMTRREQYESANHPVVSSSSAMPLHFQSSRLSYNTSTQPSLSDPMSTLAPLDTANLTGAIKNDLHPMYMSSPMITTSLPIPSQPLQSNTQSNHHQQSASTDHQLDSSKSQPDDNVQKKQNKRRHEEEDDLLDKNEDEDHQHPPRKQRASSNRLRLSHDPPRLQQSEAQLHSPISSMPLQHAQRQPNLYQLQQHNPSTMSAVQGISNNNIESQPIGKLFTLSSQPMNRNTIKQEQQVQDMSQQLSLSDQTMQAGLNSSLTLAFTDESADEDKYVQMASAEADRAKLRHRATLKKSQRKKEEDASAQGLPLSAKDKERERSRRESAVTRRRAEVYIRELERTAKRVPSLEREIASLQREMSHLKNSSSQSNASGPHSSSLGVENNGELQPGLIVNPNASKTRLMSGIKQLDL